MKSEIKSKLNNVIREHINEGSVPVYLGIQHVPPGYQIMINPDRSHFYYVNYLGEESAISCNKWQVYEWAKSDAEEKR